MQESCLFGGGYPQKRIKNKGGGVIGASGEYLLTKINKNTHLMAQFCG